MTQEEFRDKILICRSFDFIFNSRRFVISTEQKADGNIDIFFGEEFTTPEKYDSFIHLMSAAKIDSHFLRELLVCL